MISDRKNVRSGEQSIITVGLHRSSKETWLQDDSSSNLVLPNSFPLEASVDVAPQLHKTQVQQEEAKHCS